MAEAQYLGTQSPSAGRYNPNYASVTPKVHVYVEKSKVPRLPKMTLTKAPSPLQYNPKHEASSTSLRPKKQVWDKSPKKSYLDRMIKDKTKVPGPGSYNYSLNRVTSGLRRSYK